MAIDFPASPTNGQTFTSGSVTYTWDGVKWTAVAAGGGATDKITEGNTSAEVIDTGSDGRFVVTTEGSERLRVDSSGRLGIGTTTPAMNLEVRKDSSGDILQLSTPAGGGQALKVGIDTTNELCYFRLNTSSTYKHAFQNTAGTNSLVIDNSGRLLVGTSSNQGGNLLQSFGHLGLTQTASSNQINFYGTAIEFVNRNATAREMRFYVGASGGSPVASLSTAGVWTDASDISNKTNIKEIQYGIAAVKSLLPRQYDVISDGTHAVGFVAQEVQNVIPEVVNSTIAEDGTEFLGLAYGQLTAVLTKALQEAIAKIETLEAKVAALESA